MLYIHYNTVANRLNTGIMLDAFLQPRGCASIVESDNNSFDASIHAHDEAVAASGIDVWIGAEPTFTNRHSESPEWLSEALGDSKQAYACRIIKQLRERYPGSISCAPSDVSTRGSLSRAGVWACIGAVTAACWPTVCRSTR